VGEVTNTEASYHLNVFTEMRLFYCGQPFLTSSAILVMGCTPLRRTVDALDVTQRLPAFPGLQLQAHLSKCEN